MATNKAICLCRLCHSEREYKHCTGLFTADKNANLSSRISELLQVPIEKGDGLPSMVCRICIGKFMTIESKLKTLKALAQASYQTYLQSQNISESTHHIGCTRKRTQVTTGIGVSPTTSRLQPLSKRFQGNSTGKKLLFNQCGM